MMPVPQIEYTIEPTEAASSPSRLHRQHFPEPGFGHTAEAGRRISGGATMAVAANSPHFLESETDQRLRHCRALLANLRSAISRR